MESASNPNRSINRRDFVAAGASGLVAMAGTALFTQSARAAEAAHTSGAVTEFDACSAFAPETGHAWEIVPEDVPADLIGEVVDADIVVVGAGAAGVVAAHAAAEAGAKVALVERSDSFSARGHDIGGFNSQFQADNGIVMDKLDLLNAWSEITMNKTNLGLFNLWLNNSGPVMDYFVDRMANEGIECKLGAQGAAVSSSNPCIREFLTTHCFGVGQKDENGEYIMHKFVRYVENWAVEEGVDIRYNTRAVRLVKTDGRVTGVIGETVDGTYVQFNGPKGVILATGDIGGNPDMLKMWAPSAQDCPFKTYIPYGCNTGDGICLGMWAGAGHQKTNAAGMFLPTSAALGGPLFNDGGNLCWLAVNANGERFYREDVSGAMQSFAIAKQPGAVAYSIFDGNYEEDLLRNVPDGLNRSRKPYITEGFDEALQDEVDDYLLFKGDSVEELAERMGIDPTVLQATFDRYNELCDAGADVDFGKDASKLCRVDQPPFYASRIRCGMLVTIYGLNCNAHSQVCDENDVPVPGLYAVGNVQGNFFTDSYPILIPGISHGRCVTIGRILGQALARGEEL